MAEQKDDSQAARVERARRLREQIAKVKAGEPRAKAPGKKKSIREQVDEAAGKIERKSE